MVLLRIGCLRPLRIAVCVRVVVRIRYGDRVLTSSALVNTGYESDVPEVLLPVRASERLGL